MTVTRQFWQTFLIVVGGGAIISFPDEPRGLISPETIRRLAESGAIFVGLGVFLGAINAFHVHLERRRERKTDGWCPLTSDKRLNYGESALTNFVLRRM